MRRYDEHLSEAEREVMECFSAFRLPVKESALVYLGGSSGILHQLAKYRMLRYDSRLQHYTTHPLIRSYYLERMQEKPIEAVQELHNRVKGWYLDIAGAMPEVPTLDQLAPLIEAVHHACQAGVYDEASNIAWKKIDQQYRYILTHVLGAYETNLSITKEFFLYGDLYQEPQVGQPINKGYLLNTIAVCLMALGHLREAPSFYERSISYIQSDNLNSSVSYRNLADLYIFLGDLGRSVHSASEAIRMSDSAKNKEFKCNSIAKLAYILFLQGDAKANRTFQQAEILQRMIEPHTQYLYSDLGIFHAEYLIRFGELDYAQHITQTNFEICNHNHFVKSFSQCHRVLGDLGINSQVHYAEALKIARSISFRAVLITALLGYGRWLVGLGLIPISQEVKQAISHSQTEQCYMLSLRTNENPKDENDLVLARQYLDEALTYATTSGYRIYETDLRIALAWLHWREGDLITARREADRAKRASEEMGYFWGRVDASALITRID
ncbi:hypothetical protein APA_3938 [Pseudanabaena sp. lw0831]|nr:hypothetical protein APA_3938 [Pseudanabaena sp. lw0831]